MTARPKDLPFDPAQRSRLPPRSQSNGPKREERIATGSMLLHALYVASLGGDGRAMQPAVTLMLEASFGTVGRWRDEFIAMGKALVGGPGWLLLMFQPREGRLVHHWAGDPTHAVAGGVPILALDMGEHARHMNLGAAAGASVDAFMGHIDWAAVYGRYQQAVHAASEPCGASLDHVGDALVFDVRRAGVFDNARTMIAGARWCDPANVATWVAALPADRALVVYCVHGHEVSRATAMRLRAAGLDARFLIGGIDAWQAAGRPLVDKRQGPVS